MRNVKNYGHERVRSGLVRSRHHLTLLPSNIWVAADDPGVRPKFWSYGITNGKYHSGDPRITLPNSVSRPRRRSLLGPLTDAVWLVIESNRIGWWIATGLYEFGQIGHHHLQGGALRATALSMKWLYSMQSGRKLPPSGWWFLLWRETLEITCILSEP